MSRYLVMVRFVPGRGPAEGSPEHATEMGAWDHFNRELEASGRFVQSFGLDPSRRVLPHEASSQGDGEVVFAQYVIDADEVGEVEEWVARMPVLDYGSAEIRRVMFEGPR